MSRPPTARSSNDRQRFGSRNGIARQASIGHDIDSLPVDQEFLPFDAFLNESRSERHSPGSGVVDPVSELQTMQSARRQGPVRNGNHRAARPATSPRRGMGPVPEPRVAIPGIDAQGNEPEQQIIIPHHCEWQMRTIGSKQPCDVCLCFQSICNPPLPSHVISRRECFQDPRRVTGL